MPSTIRLYKTGFDQILVENPEKKGEYITFCSYLKQVEETKGEAERNIRQAQLEKLVEWYE